MHLTLMLLSLVVLIAVWLIGSAVRLEVNPQDKLLPGLSQMIAAIDRMAFTPDKHSDEHLLWVDTLIGLSRLLMGLAVSSLIGFGIGIATGVFPMYRAALPPLMTMVSMIPPPAILPVLFTVFGLDELPRVTLIVIGIAPMLARDLEQRAKEIPAELFIRAQTLGANSWTLVLRVVLPQPLSWLITPPRLLLGSARLFLISAEATSVIAGLGYRIFLVRRYMAVDVVIPYVIRIILLAWSMDLALRQLHKVRLPWAEGGRGWVLSTSKTSGRSTVNT